MDLTHTKAFCGFYTVDIFECAPFVMFTADDCPASVRILNGRTFEQMSTKIWARLACVATGIFDIGAHVGVYSLVAASLRPDLQIQAFEPNPYAYARLRLHKTINTFSNIVENRIALSDTDGITRIQWYRKDNLPISSGGTICDVGDRADFDSAIADMRRLDSLQLEIGQRGLIKIDVESAEMAVLRGATEILRHRPDIIVECFSSVRAEQMNQMLLPSGYRAYRILEDQRRVVPTDGLKKADQSGQDFNQLLTVRPASEIEAILAD